MAIANFAADNLTLASFEEFMMATRTSTDATTTTDEATTTTAPATTTTTVTTTTTPTTTTTSTTSTTPQPVIIDNPNTIEPLGDNVRDSEQLSDTQEPRNSSTLLSTLSGNLGAAKKPPISNLLDALSRPNEDQSQPLLTTAIQTLQEMLDNNEIRPEDIVDNHDLIVAQLEAAEANALAGFGEVGEAEMADLGVTGGPEVGGMGELVDIPTTTEEFIDVFDREPIPMLTTSAPPTTTTTDAPRLSCIGRRCFRVPEAGMTNEFVDMLATLSHLDKEEKVMAKPIMETPNLQQQLQQFITGNASPAPPTKKPRLSTSDLPVKTVINMNPRNRWEVPWNDPRYSTIVPRSQTNRVFMSHRQIHPRSQIRIMGL